MRSSRDKSNSLASSQAIFTIRNDNETEPGCQARSCIASSCGAREGRRTGTIYIASDNTNILTIHPGRGHTVTGRGTPKSSVRLIKFPNDGRGHSASAHLQAENVMCKILRTAPQRPVLLPALLTVQKLPPNGRPGESPGKENLLPDRVMPSNVRKQRISCLRVR